ncbi:hypothetical protein ACFVVU_15105 [Kitasatospora sp. NPDC057965]|uniref:hypothetical protein n=1 Tax=Kitasatospora sp. NPDC057965 TaxID=3346291 RepID=UPI0036DDADFF
MDAFTRSLMDLAAEAEQRITDQHERIEGLRREVTQVQALLGTAERYLTVLERTRDNLRESLVDLAPPPGGDAQQSMGRLAHATPADSGDRSGPTAHPTDSEQPQEAPSPTSMGDGQGASAVGGTEPSLPQFILQILATSQEPMRAADILAVITHLQSLGRTNKLVGTAQPIASVSNALRRLNQRGKLRKTAPGLYALPLAGTPGAPSEEVAERGH